MAVDTKQEAQVIETREVNVADLAVAVDVVLDNPGATQVALEGRLERRKQLMRIAFSMTSPSQWVKFEDAKTGKASIYPQGGAADAILRHIFACSWQNKSYVIENDDKGEPKSCAYTATLVNQNGQPIETFTGFRELGGFVRTKPDLISGAAENCKSKAVRDVLGLRGRTPEELAALGLDLSKVGSAQFQNNKAGPGEVPVFAFGKCKGKAANDPSVTLADLTWYAERCKESLADPEKAKWKKSEEKKLAAYRAEYERRVAESKAPKTAQPADPVSSEEFDRETGEVREPGDDGR